MSWKNCEHCGREIAPDSGVTHSTFFEQMFGKGHHFCCKACREAAIKNGEIKAHSNGCLVVIAIVIIVIIVAGSSN